MRKFTNPLDNIHVASPCSADWNEMYGNDRKRFCGDCKLNVYNLSDMTRQEAENLLMNSEGRLCVRFFRRADGTVLTKDCPVGWQAIKTKVARTASASFAFGLAFLGGLFAFNQSIRIRDHQSSLPQLETQIPANHVLKVDVATSVPQVQVLGRFEIGGATSDVFEKTKKTRKH